VRAAAFLLLATAACWRGPAEPTVIVREVPTYRYIHDVPRECPGLPEFPSVKTLGDRTHFVTPYIAQLDAWVQAAGACLYAHTYHIDQLVEETPFP
jgi:hypothetical protein